MRMSGYGSTLSSLLTIGFVECTVEKHSNLLRLDILQSILCIYETGGARTLWTKQNNSSLRGALLATKQSTLSLDS
jgi:hypothetical protein